MTTLAHGANFEIVVEGSFVRCRVMNSDSVTREEGARCAELMRSVLREQVLVPGSPYSGLVFDVRQGPEVFGPVTRGMLEGIFQAAEGAKKRLAVRIGSAAMQRLQFSNLCRECAPKESKIVESDVDEAAWARR